MTLEKNIRGLTMVLLASIVLALSVSFSQTNLILEVFIYFIIILSANILIKKAIGYYLETTVTTRFWSWYHYWFRKDSHFKKPVPMIWLPLIVSLFTRGFFWWLAVLEFDVEAKSERVSRRHGLYRFTEVTEWHMGIIAMWGIIINIALGILGYLVGFELFAKLSFYYAAWSILPLSSLDGSKILFASRGLWVTLLIVAGLFLSWGIVI